MIKNRYLRCIFVVCIVGLFMLSGCKRNNNVVSNTDSSSSTETSYTNNVEKNTTDNSESATTVENSTTSETVDSIDGIKKVCIDPGHQKKGNPEQEPVGPGAEKTKKKVSDGTQGVYTRIPEYELTLEVSLMLRDELIKRGYEVVMTREVHEVDISNAERAIFGNQSGADIAVRIHANGFDKESVHGASTIYPSPANPYTPAISDNSKLLSVSIIEELCKATGAKNRGASASDNYTGNNWSTIPVTIVEMGFMTNKEEDKLMSTEDYREKIVKGIADGIDRYFSEIDKY